MEQSASYNAYLAISIHALLAESDDVIAVMTEAQSISIHALLAESDRDKKIQDTSTCLFLSTLSLRRATIHYDNYNLHCVISIHALLAESDIHQGQRTEFYAHFYPRSPCGERQATKSVQGASNQFLSTLSLRRATDKKIQDTSTCLFLSTLSLRRATAPNHNPCQRNRNFYPRSPCGERQSK